MATSAPAALPTRHGVFTVRPAGEARGLLAALRRRGLAARNLAPVRLVAVDPGTALGAAAAGAGRWLFTSPAAVRFLQQAAGRHAPALFAADGRLARLAGQGRVFAPGPGTARALARAGIAGVRHPLASHDSEGLLALPALAAPLDDGLVLVGAPDGRGVLAPALAARGAEVTELMVYRRQQAAPAAAALRDLAAAPAPLLVVGSAALLQALWLALPSGLRDHLRRHGRLVAASPRIASAAGALGLPVGAVAGSATPGSLAAATASFAAGTAIPGPAESRPKPAATLRQTVFADATRGIRVNISP